MNRMITIASFAVLFIASNFSGAVLSTASAADVSRDWSRFSPSDRAACLGWTMRKSGTYSGLLSCLETKRDTNQLPKDPADAASDEQAAEYAR
jgi:hypothetical protein